MKKINSIMKLSNNSSFVILIFEILKFRNIDRSTFRHSKFWHPPTGSNMILHPQMILVIYENLQDFPLRGLKNCSTYLYPELCTTVRIALKCSSKRS